MSFERLFRSVRRDLLLASRRMAVDAEALKQTSIDDNKCASIGRTKMRTTLALDDELVAKAQAFTGLKEKSSLVREALKALIERESARRLARLGGSQPGLKAPARGRPSAT